MDGNIAVIELKKKRSRGEKMGKKCGSDRGGKELGKGRG